MRCVAAVDKFRGTATAEQVCDAIANGCWELGVECDQFPLADGGEGLLSVLGGPTRTSTVTGPLGRPVEVPWRLAQRTAVIEMALASGLVLAGGAEHNDPLAATTAGTGELIMQAVSAGAKRVIVGLGGSATTDGGLGAIEAIGNPSRLAHIDLLVACDVTTRFVDAAAVFGPQKGASAAQVKMLTRRLMSIAERYQTDFGVDITSLPGGGAAGGLGGALAAIGGRLEPGFALVADETGLYDALDGADLVITGEGFVDAQSFSGKVVGGVAGLAADHSVPCAVIAGDIDARLDPQHTRGLAMWSLTELFGLDLAMRETQRCIELAVGQVLPAWM